MTVRSVIELVLWSLSSSLRGFSVVILAITSHSVSAEYQCHTYSHLWLQHFCMVPSRTLLLLLLLFFYCSCDVREMLVKERRRKKEDYKMWIARTIFLKIHLKSQRFFYASYTLCMLEKWLIGSLWPNFNPFKFNLGLRAFWQCPFPQWCNWIGRFNVQHHWLISS